ncbi:MAG: RodZ domain-containing protein [Actinomycetes bacterium]
MSVGNYLREARESAGYSVEKIASLTRIPQTVIRDLEEEKFSSSGGTTYARGHIRTIAKLLNADTDRLISSFEEITGESNRPMIELLEENNATALRRKQSLNISPKLIATAASVIVGVAIIIPTGMALSKSLTHKSSVSTVATSQSHSSSAQKTTTNATPSTPSGTVTTGRGVVVTASAGTSWLSVNDSQGTKIFSGKISNGQSQTFDPSNGLFMTVGNAGAVTVTVNGKSQGLLGAVGEVKTLSFEPPASNG